tara:strand:+ start:816 stop:926 length:111 start_codon:yes stop_codon:yes gene_type:complete
MNISFLGILEFFVVIIISLKIFMKEEIKFLFNKIFI